ncbi:hypothetical protein ACC713_37075, partial [Rhizobium johnstonii]|uniref:hypothetical protein n=1 Tax=Rhizobium johnstonii TaxID=3019933 RepID=UPI003F9DF0D5
SFHDAIDVFDRSALLDLRRALIHGSPNGANHLKYLENHSGCRIFDPTLRRTIADGLWPVWEFPNTARSA